MIQQMRLHDVALVLQYSEAHGCGGCTEVCVGLSHLRDEFEDSGEGLADQEVEAERYKVMRHD